MRVYLDTGPILKVRMLCGKALVPYTTMIKYISKYQWLTIVAWASCFLMVVLGIYLFYATLIVPLTTKPPGVRIVTPRPWFYEKAQPPQHHGHRGLWAPNIRHDPAGNCAAVDYPNNVVFIYSLKSNASFLLDNCPEASQPLTLPVTPKSSLIGLIRKDAVILVRDGSSIQVFQLNDREFTYLFGLEDSRMSSAATERPPVTQDFFERVQKYSDHIGEELYHGEVRVPASPHDSHNLEPGM